MTAAPEIPFVKMHGAGNDYVMVDGFAHVVAEPAALARRISRRHFGVGSDGLIVVEPTDAGDLRMRMWNADGSESGMCGNGIRLAVKLGCEAGHASGDQVKVEVGLPGARRVLPVDVRREGGRVVWARIDMGAPRLLRGEVPVTGPADEEALAVTIQLDGQEQPIVLTGVSMGNPHGVVFLDHPPRDDEVLVLGPVLEVHPVFPERANISWAFCEEPGRIRLRVWERGAGETLACGSGACATTAAAIRTGRLGARRAVVSLPGGDLEVDWPSDDGSIHLAGPAEEAFRGVVRLGPEAGAG
jgi:diaminopimelate epimerase